MIKNFNTYNESLKDKLKGPSKENMDELLNTKLYTLNDMIDAFIAGSNDTIRNRADVFSRLKYEHLIKNIRYD